MQIYRVIRDFLLSIIPDKMYLSLMFRRRMGYWMDWKRPKTFNEKLQWLKIHDRRDEYTKMVDKAAAKEYVASIIGEKYIIPTLALYDRVEDINFDTLPNEFVMKCTHDSGGIVVCHDKSILNKDKSLDIMRKGLSKSFYKRYREYPYKKVKHRVLIEECLSSENEELLDYKFMCYNGVCKNVFVCTGRSKKDLRVDFFDLNWNHLPFQRLYPNADYDIPRPQNLEEMILLSNKLSSSINNPFVRIDFYNTQGHVYFGEITFYPGAALESFSPMEWDYRFGDLIEIPIES